MRYKKYIKIIGSVLTSPLYTLFTFYTNYLSFLGCCGGRLGRLPCGRLGLFCWGPLCCGGCCLCCLVCCCCFCFLFLSAFSSDCKLIWPTSSTNSGSASFPFDAVRSTASSSSGITPC